MTERRCGTYDGVYIPGCWGGLYDKRDCYCPPRNKEDEIQKMAAAIAKLERRVKALEAAPNVLGGSSPEGETPA